MNPRLERNQALINQEIYKYQKLVDSNQMSVDEVVKNIKETLSLYANDADLKQLLSEEQRAKKVNILNAMLSHFSPNKNTFSSFFKENPNKILGTLTQESGRFGPVQVVKGDFTEIDRIDVSESLVPSIRSGSMAVDVNALKNIQASITLQKSISRSKRSTKALKQEKMNKSGNCILPVSADSYKLFSNPEAFEFLNPNIDPKDVEVWVFHCLQTNRPLHPYLLDNFSRAYSNEWYKEMLSAGYLCFDPRTQKYVPRVIYYSGNIFERIKDLDRSFNESILGDELKQLQHAKLKELAPEYLVLTGPVNERLVLDPLSKFCSTMEVDIDGSIESILDHFKTFLRNVDQSQQKTSVSLFYLYSYILDGNRLPNRLNKDEKEIVKRDCLIESTHFMSIFLEELPADVQQLIETRWNLENNGFIDPNYSQVPIMFNCNKIFKKGPLQIRPEQRVAVAFQEINGTGVCGYDVGIGKTLSAILTLAQFLQSGRAKRAIVAVPKQTYYKWIGEIHGLYDESGVLVSEGILPQYKINDLYNLSKSILETGFEIEDNTITFVTYEGLKKIGFSDEIDQTFIENLSLILSQNDPNMTNRQIALENDKLLSEISEGKYNSSAMMDQSEWDYLTIDEAHNCNKLFMSVKGVTSEDGKREPSRFSFNNGGQSSLLAKKAFFLSQYVQHISNGLGNVNLLTATPFTNNPLNVFNIFTLANFNQLKSYGIENVNTFFEKYVDVTYEKVVTSKGDIEEREIIKGWKNKVALQKIMFGIVNYKSAEESPYIKRPIKITLPLVSMKDGEKTIMLPPSDQISTILTPTDRQKRNIQEISIWLSNALTDSEAMKRAPHLVADQMSSKNTLSPHIYEGISPSEITPKEFIDESPKLKATMLVIDGINKFHEKQNTERSCQIIYINGGIEYMPLIKAYLIDYLGYKTNVSVDGADTYDEVEILAGTTDDERKESVKNLFNDGIVKIIIGSSMIREGIDLQKRTTTLHNLWIDWNPTDYKQLEGRIWRFGNIWDYVRIISYLLTGGSDSFKYQKLEEKTARINDIFDRKDKANILEVTDEDREAVKWALIDDVSVIAKDKIRDETKAIKKEIKIIEDKSSKIENIRYDLSQLSTLETFLNDRITRLKGFPILEKAYPDFYSMNQEESFRFVMLNYSKFTKEFPVLRDSYILDWQFGQKLSEYKKLFKKITKLDEQYQKERNKSIYDIDIQTEVQRLSDEISDLNLKIEHINSDQYFEEMESELQEKKDKTASVSKTPEQIAAGILTLNEKCLNNRSFSSEIKSPAPVQNSPGTGEIVTPPTIENAAVPDTEVEIDGSNRESIIEAIEALKITLDFQPDNKSIQEAIQALEITLEF